MGERFDIFSAGGRYLGYVRVSPGLGIGDILGMILFAIQLGILIAIVITMPLWLGIVILVKVSTDGWESVSGGTYAIWVLSIVVWLAYFGLTSHVEYVEERRIVHIEQETERGCSGITIGVEEFRVDLFPHVKVFSTILITNTTDQEIEIALEGKTRLTGDVYPSHAREGYEHKYRGKVRADYTAVHTQKGVHAGSVLREGMRVIQVDNFRINYSVYVQDLEGFRREVECPTQLIPMGEILSSKDAVVVKSEVLVAATLFRLCRLVDVQISGARMVQDSVGRDVLRASASIKNGANFPVEVVVVFLPQGVRSAYCTANIPGKLGRCSIDQLLSWSAKESKEIFGKVGVHGYKVDAGSLEAKCAGYPY